MKNKDKKKLKKKDNKAKNLYNIKEKKHLEQEFKQMVDLKYT